MVKLVWAFDYISKHYFFTFLLVFFENFIDEYALSIYNLFVFVLQFKCLLI